jgi:hypothetical protein
VAGPWLIALLATLAVLLTLSPEAGGPGVTCDELYHVATGKRLVAALRHQGLAFFTPERVRDNFPWRPDGPPVHPPLGNWLLGLAHHVFDPAPDDPNVVSIAAARFAPALAFGALVAIVGLWAHRRDGPLAGCVAAAAVVLVPRVFAHAHLAALDTFTAMTFVAAALAASEADRRGGGGWRFAAAGCVWGLAMLVRLHGVLVLPPVVVWLGWRLRRRALLPITAWVTAGAATLLAGWPWLWYSTFDHVRQYLGTATARAAVHVYYVGRVWLDYEVPRHYTVIMFLVTLPAGLLLLGLLGIWVKRHSCRADPGFVLVVGTLLWVLAVFSWPGTPVYDGVRLFLMVFPLWAICVGAGAAWAVRQLHAVCQNGAASPRSLWVRFTVARPLPIRERVRVRAATGLVLVFVTLQGAGLIVYHPCQLSHYNLFVGGLAGAERLGFEVTYWGDSVREPVLAEAATRAAGRPILFGPNLAPFQAPGVAASSPALASGELSLVGWDPGRPRDVARCRLGVVYHRKADLAQVEPLLRGTRVIAEYEKQGVWLARLVEFAAPIERLMGGAEPVQRGDGPNPPAIAPRRKVSKD